MNSQAKVYLLSIILFYSLSILGYLENFVANLIVSLISSERTYHMTKEYCIIIYNESNDWREFKLRGYNL